MIGAKRLAVAICFKVLSMLNMKFGWSTKVNMNDSILIQHNLAIVSSCASYCRYHFFSIGWRIFLSDMTLNSCCYCVTGKLWDNERFWRAYNHLVHGRFVTSPDRNQWYSEYNNRLLYGRVSYIEVHRIEVCMYHISLILRPSDRYILW